MTKKEAEKVADVLVTADGGCSTCLHALVEEIQSVFPQFSWKELTDEAKVRWELK